MERARMTTLSCAPAGVPDASPLFPIQTPADAAPQAPSQHCTRVPATKCPDLVDVLPPQPDPRHPRPRPGAAWTEACSHAKRFAQQRPGPQEAVAAPTNGVEHDASQTAPALRVLQVQPRFCIQCCCALRPLTPRASGPQWQLPLLLLPAARGCCCGGRRTPQERRQRRRQPREARGRPLRRPPARHARGTCGTP